MNRKFSYIDSGAIQKVDINIVPESLNNYLILALIVQKKYNDCLGKHVKFLRGKYTDLSGLITEVNVSINNQEFSCIFGINISNCHGHHKITDDELISTIFMTDEQIEHVS